MSGIYGLPPIVSDLDHKASLVIEAKRIEVTDYEANKLAELYDNNLISKQQLLSIYNTLKNKIDIINNITNVEYIDNKFNKIDDGMYKIDKDINKINSEIVNESNKLDDTIYKFNNRIEVERAQRGVDVGNLINFIVKENNDRVNADDQLNFDLKRYADKLNISLLQTVDEVAGGMKSVSTKLEEMKDNSIKKTEDIILDYNKKIKATVAEINECYISDKVRIVDKINEVNIVPIEVKNEMGDWENITTKLPIGGNNNLQKLTVILLFIIIVISVIIGLALIIVLSTNLVKLFAAIMMISLFIIGIGYIIRSIKSNIDILKIFEKIL